MHKQHVEIAGAAFVGVGSFIYGAFGDDTFSPGDARALGVLLILGSLLALVSYRTQRRDRVVFDLGRMKGHQEGYSEGRRVGKPIVLPFPASGQLREGLVPFSSADPPN